MGTVNLKTASGGSVILNPANTSVDVTIVVPASNGTMAINGPAFRANTVTAQTIPNSTFTKVAYNVEEFDTNNNFDNVTNYRFTPTVAGYYQINANASLSGGSSGYVQCALFKNGSPHTNGSGIPNNGNIGGLVTVASVVFLNGSTDYVEFYLWQGQGSSINLQTSPGFNTFSGAMVRSS